MGGSRHRPEGAQSQPAAGNGIPASRCQARIDRTAKVWYGAFKIPIESIPGGAAKEGAEYRVNFYRIQGPLPDRLLIAWRPTMQGTYHVPEKFGRLKTH